MTSAKSATELAAYQLLTELVTLATVYQDVPEDTPPPVVIIGDINADPIGPPDDPDRRVSLSIVTVTAGEERRPCLDVQEQIEEMSGRSVTLEGWTLHFAFESDDATITGDGGGYVGNSHFTIVALRD